jgi:hypothetical protein
MPIQTELLATILARLRPDNRPADAASAAGIWRTLFDCFGPLIGPLSVGLLFERTMIKHVDAFPWLEEAIDAASGARVLDVFTLLLDGLPAPDIEAANRAMLTTYTDELAGLIGASLTSRLLQTAFGRDGVLDNT